jgi:hypothetical protein
MVLPLTLLLLLQLNLAFGNMGYGKLARSETHFGEKAARLIKCVDLVGYIGIFGSAFNPYSYFQIAGTTVLITIDILAIQSSP